MDKIKVVYTNTAKENLRAIITYYHDKVSPKMAINIKNGIVETVNLLKSSHYNGRIEETLKVTNKEYHYVIAKNYKIIYIEENGIRYITLIFDCRQDPDKLSI